MGQPCEIKIAFFGDSIINGKGVSIHKTFSCLLSKQLEEEYKTEANIVLTTMSRNGDTTRDALEKLHYFFNTSYDIVVVQFGMNDCNKWTTEKGFHRVFEKTFAANLMEILIRIYGCGINTVFVCTNHQSTKIEYERDNSEYNKTIREVCALRSVPVIDMEKKIEISQFYDGNYKGHVLPDGVHLSEYGHLLYFNAIKPYLDREIKKILTRGKV